MRGHKYAFHFTSESDIYRAGSRNVTFILRHVALRKSYGPGEDIHAAIFAVQSVGAGDYRCCIASVAAVPDQKGTYCKINFSWVGFNLTPFGAVHACSNSLQGVS